MPVRIRTLRVLPNPYLYIDEKGRPAGACPCDPNEHTPDRRWVGATIGEALLVSPAVTRVVAGVSQTIAPAVHDLRWSYVSEPVELPNTGYYRDKIAKGELFAADSRTAIEAGITEFRQPADLLAEAKVEAIKDFDAHNGKGAFALLNEQYEQDEQSRKAIAAAVAKERGEPESKTTRTTPPAGGKG